MVQRREHNVIITIPALLFLFGNIHPLRLNGLT